MLKAYYTWLPIFETIEATNLQRCFNIVTLSLLITVVMNLQFSLLSSLSLLCLTALHYHFSPITLQLVTSHSIPITHYDTGSVQPLPYPLPINEGHCIHYQPITHYSLIELSSVPITSPLLGSFRQLNFSLIIITEQHTLLIIISIKISNSNE